MFFVELRAARRTSSRSVSPAPPPAAGPAALECGYHGNLSSSSKSAVQVQRAGRRPAGRACPGGARCRTRTAAPRGSRGPAYAEDAATSGLHRTGDPAAFIAESSPAAPARSSPPRAGWRGVRAPGGGRGLHRRRGAGRLRPRRIARSGRSRRRASSPTSSRWGSRSGTATRSARWSPRRAIARVVRERDGVLQHVRRQPRLGRRPGCAVLDVIRDERLQARARGAGCAVPATGLRDLRWAAIGDRRRPRAGGCSWGIELVRRPRTASRRRPPRRAVEGGAEAAGSPPLTDGPPTTC